MKRSRHVVPSCVKLAACGLRGSGRAVAAFDVIMPIYEYQCPQCGHVFEEWVKAAEAHGQEPCPQCGTASPRVISQTSFVLKGGGWYVSDYGYRKNIKEDGLPPPAGESSGDKAPSQGSEPAGAASGAPEAASAAKAEPAPPTPKASAETGNAASSVKAATPAKAQPPSKAAPGKAAAS